MYKHNWKYVCIAKLSFVVFSLSSTRELLAFANLTRSAVALSVLQWSKVVKSFSWVNHTIGNFSITERASQLFFLSFWINVPGVTVSFYIQQKVWIPFLRALANGNLKKTLIASDTQPLFSLYFGAGPPKKRRDKLIIKMLR